MNRTALRLQIVALGLVVLGLCFGAISYAASYATMGRVITLAYVGSLLFVFYRLARRSGRRPYHGISGGEFALIMILLIVGGFIALNWRPIFREVAGYNYHAHPTPVWVIFFWQSWWIFVSIGLLVFLGAHFLGLKKTQTKGALMLIPKQWNEMEISNAMMGVRSAPTSLLRVLDQIGERFILGQETKVAKVRVAYLETVLKQIGLTRELYGWKMAIENKLIDQEEQERLKQFQRKSKLAELEDQAREEELLTKIVEEKKKRADLTKVSVPETKQQSDEEKKRQRKRELDDSKEVVEKEMRIVDADPTLSPDRKTQKLNMLHDRLNEIEEELIRLL